MMTDSVVDLIERFCDPDRAHSQAKKKRQPAKKRMRLQDSKDKVEDPGIVLEQIKELCKEIG